MKDLNLRQIGKLEESLRTLSKNATQLENRNSELQNHLFKRKDEIDAIKADFRFNQAEYDNWLTVLRQKEQDIDAIEKYATSDNAHIRDVQMNIEKIQKELSKRKGELEQEVTNTQSLQIELDKTSDDFLAIQKRRHDLLKRFEDLVNTMKDRDEQIKQNKDKFADQMLEMERQTNVRAELHTVLDQYDTHNKQLEAQVRTIDATLQRFLTEKQTWEATVQHDADEQMVQRTVLTKARTARGAAHAEVTENNENVRLKEEQQQKQKERLEQRRQELKNITDETLTKQEQSEKMEAMLSEEENRYNLALREMKTIKDDIFKFSQILFDSAQQKTNTIAEINGAETNLKNLQVKIKKLDGQSQRQNEIIYRADFQIQVMERKLPRAQGVRSDEEKQKLNAEIGQLTNELEFQNNQHTILTQQVKRVDEEIKDITTKIEAVKHEKQMIDSWIADLKLNNDNTTRQLTKYKVDKEELAVRGDLLQLELKRLNDTFHQRHTEVVSLKNRQTQLEITIKQRQAEIKTHNDLLRAELRLLQEERHKTVKELNERTLAIEKLKQKYESVIAIRGGNSSEETAKSHALAIVQAAQKRQELESKGDELDAQIKAKQRELLQLEATLNTMQHSNNDYRALLRGGGQAGEEATQQAEEKAAAAEQLKNVQERLRKLRKDLEETLQLLSYQQKMLSESALETDVLTRETQEHALRRQQLEKDVPAQTPKIERAQKQLAKMATDHKARHSVPGDADTDAEREFQYDELKETNTIILASLQQIGAQDGRVGPVLGGLLKEFRIPATSATATADRKSVV